MHSRPGSHKQQEPTAGSAIKGHSARVPALARAGRPPGVSRWGVCAARTRAGLTPGCPARQGRAAGTAAYMLTLRRERIGQHCVDDAWSLADLIAAAHAARGVAASPAPS